jgi:hypothetical protein
MSDQILLTNSKRRHEKRTYTPLIITDPDEGSSSDALGLAARVRALMLTSAEEALLRERLERPGELAAVDAMNNLATAVSASGVLAAASSLTMVSRRDLRSVSKALGAIRSDAANHIIGALHDLDKLYASEIAYSQIPPGRVAEDSQQTTPPASVHPSERGLGTLIADSIEKLTTKLAVGVVPSPVRDVKLHVPEGSLTAPRAADLALASATLPHEATPVSLSRMLQVAVGPALAERAPSVLAWAALKRTEQLRPLLDVTQQYMPNEVNPVARITGAVANLTRLQLLTQLFSESLTQRPLQPLGLLHLERLEMIPGGIERGELAYSLPLAPNEKVTLAHREWSVREEQFSEFIEDFLENFSEQGVAQTDDISLSTSTQSSHNNALSMSQPIASANGVHVTTPLDTTQSAAIDDTETKEESKSQSRTVTALASTRTMKDHKISFTVTTVSGMEDFTAHLIENKHGDKSMRIDYFKRVRNWQSNLYRYGVRLTYDVVLPDPGARLRAREVELQHIADELATEFHLMLTPSQITIFNWEGLADQYGVALPAPPEQVRQIETTQGLNYATPFDRNTGSDGAQWNESQRLTPLSITIPLGYSLSNLHIEASFVTFFDNNLPPGWVIVYYGASWNSAGPDPSNHWVTFQLDVGPQQVPADGQISILFVTQFAASGALKLGATVVPSDSTMEAWRLACWTIIRDGSAARAAQHRSYLRERQGALQKQIAGDDPVRLRRMEREAIMRSVLEWLFPGFQDASSVLANLPSPGFLDPGTWQQVMQYGEYIKFVQTAIDWDNVMVFLYPYFWDTIWHEQEKLFLNHPDIVHREFLRAGAARVILAIQPGFEEQVISLLDKGQLGNLPDQGRFTAAIEYVHSTNAEYADTANSGESSKDLNEPGILLGSWTDHTPSSALDIQTTLMSVITE